jgi:cytosine deaminase
VVVGENITFLGAEEYLRSQGIQIQVLQDRECADLMQEFIKASPNLWNEDIGI